MTSPTLATLCRNPVQLLAFGFGSGLSPKAPGTVGSAVAVVFYLPLALLPLIPYTVMVLLCLLLGVWLCGEASRQLGVHDHGGIVWDEFVGLWITLWAVPSGWQWIVAGFLLFRLFDIVKPWPISWLDRSVDGGLGIMIDDVVAGLCAGLILQFTAWVLGSSLWLA